MQDFTLLPAALAPLFGSEFVAGVFLSAIVFLAMTLPAAILTADKGKAIVPVFAATLSIILTVALGWLPSWALLVGVMAVICVFMIMGRE